MIATSKTTDGTSFFGVTIQATVKSLTQLLGKPAYDYNDGTEKVNYTWEMETSNGDVFTVYDWKEYRPIHEDEHIEWHIGGFNAEATEQARKELINTYYKGKHFLQ